MGAPAKVLRIGEVEELPPVEGIVPERLYEAEEVAAALKLRKKDGTPNARSVYRIPRRKLPVVPVGPNGGRLLYYGRDVLHYIASSRKAS